MAPQQNETRADGDHFNINCLSMFMNFVLLTDFTHPAAASGFAANAITVRVCNCHKEIAASGMGDVRLNSTTRSFDCKRSHRKCRVKFERPAPKGAALRTHAPFSL